MTHFQIPNIFETSREIAIVTVIGRHTSFLCEKPPVRPNQRAILNIYRMSHDRWHAFNQSEVLNAVQYSVVFPFTGVRCTQRASIGYWPGPISNTGPPSTPGKENNFHKRGSTHQLASNIPQKRNTCTPKHVIIRVAYFSQQERGTSQRTTSCLTASHLAKTPSPP